jgi:hypothetical protein
MRKRWPDVFLASIVYLLNILTTVRALDKNDNRWALKKKLISAVRVFACAQSVDESKWRADE